MKSNGTAALVEQDRKLLAGVEKDLANQSFTINDKSCTAQDVVNVLQGRISKGLAVEAARAALQTAAKALREERTQSAGFVSAFRTIVKGMFRSREPHRRPTRRPSRRQRARDLTKTGGGGEVGPRFPSTLCARRFAAPDANNPRVLRAGPTPPSRRMRLETDSQL